MTVQIDTGDNDAIFTQTDHEFALDTAHNPSHRQLMDFLENTDGSDLETMEFMRGYMLDINVRDINE